VIIYLATQAQVVPDSYVQYNWQGRSIKEHRAQIREVLGFREATVADAEEMTTWLVDQGLPQEHQDERLHELVYQQYQDLKIEVPALSRIMRQIRSARRTFVQQFYETICAKIPDGTKATLEQLLADEEEGGAYLEQVTLLHLRHDSGQVGLNTMLTEIAKLRRLRKLSLQLDLFIGFARKVLRVYRNRASIGEPSRLRAHAVSMRLTLLATSCTLRVQETTDALVELLIQLVHRIVIRAEERVETEYVNELKHQVSKDRLLYQIAEAVWKARKFADMVLIKTLSRPVCASVSWSMYASPMSIWSAVRYGSIRASATRTVLFLSRSRFANCLACICSNAPRPMSTSRLVAASIMTGRYSRCLPATRLQQGLPVRFSTTIGGIFSSLGSRSKESMVRSSRRIQCMRAERRSKSTLGTRSQKRSNSMTRRWETFPFSSVPPARK
jgi:hypothetical protein